MIQLIYNFIKHWFKGLNSTSKVLTLLLLFALSYGAYITIQKAIYKYKYFKTIEKEVTTLRDSISQYEIRITDLIEKAKTTTIKSQKKSKQIDDKLTQDEKIIDNTTVTNDDLDKFLAKYD